MQLQAATVAERLGLGDDHAGWLASLEQLGPTADGLPLPPADEAAELLDGVALDAADREALRAAWPAPDRTPELWWLLERAYHGVALDVGNLDAMRPTPALPASLDADGRCFWIFVYL